MELLLIKAGLPLDSVTLGQVLDATRVCINIWGRKHGEIAIHELVRAILQDEPMKMRRLAEIFRVDVAAIHEMWIVQSAEEESKRLFTDRLPALKDSFAGFSGSLIMDVYGGRLLIFMSTPLTQQEAERMTETVMEAVSSGLRTPRSAVAPACRTPQMSAPPTSAAKTASRMHSASTRRGVSLPWATWSLRAPAAS